MPARKAVPRSTPSASYMNSTAATRASSTARNPASKPLPSKPSAVVQIPPELAHLNVEPPPRPSLQKPLPPLRPSRDGTPSMPDINLHSRVVHSDLPPLYTTYHKRTPSQETPGPVASPSFRQRLGLSSRSSSRQPSPRLDSAISPPPSARKFTRAPTPEVSNAEPEKLHRTDSPAIGPVPRPSKSPRFGIFSRKPRADAGKPAEKPKRKPRKGPAAGTGHEGYGRFNFRGRSSSTASSADSRSPSADSNASSNAPRPAANRKDSFGSSKEDSDFEIFVQERQRPVILRGSGSTYSNAASTTDLQPASAFASSTSTSIDSLPKPQLLPSAMQNDSGESLAQRGPASRRFASRGEEEDARSGYPTLAARRSQSKLTPADS
ncbi:hypothetical protein LTR53_018114, partial [Teratosphaeriaceae sp. CCFEE 6253]